VLKGHTGSVLCLQYDDNYIISASSDSTVRSVCVATIPFIPFHSILKSVFVYSLYTSLFTIVNCRLISNVSDVQKTQFMRKSN